MGLSLTIEPGQAETLVGLTQAFKPLPLLSSQVRWRAMLLLFHRAM
ncbi:protein of unknown function, might belong to Surface protein Lk90-like protein [Shewanella benthica]|uniref:Uncharacterized protein n=1 Tax=Shewanella benthica TaxID=43661 RepID=A0A330M397_9GAMM|nr:hypothetical protein [Shewanella benthica]SQH75510.1 protein of unknown function, might belong to Surface protein Lk90-like protein [Shewanella benthica]